MSTKTSLDNGNQAADYYVRLQNRIAELERKIVECTQLAEQTEIANRKLSESEARFKMISDFSNDWEVFRDQNNKIIYCSPSIERLLGYTVEEYITKISFADYVYPDDFQYAISEYKKLANGEYPSPVQFRFIKKNGEIIWVETSGQPIYTSTGERIGFRTSTRDITEHKRIEKELKDSEYIYKNLFEFMDEGVLRTDQNGDIILTNNAFARMFGYSNTDDIIGEHVTLLYPAETRAKMIENLDKAHHLYNYEILTKTKQGEDIYVLCNFKNNLNENGEIVYREGIIRDITSLKRAEIALRNSEAKLIEANSTKDKFISILSHDLRSPFNTIIGLSDLLREEFENEDDTKISQIVNCIHDVSTNTYLFLEELLEWARLQQNLISFSPENIQLNQIVEECILMMTDTSKRKNIEIGYQFSEDLHVIADRYMLKTILRNLLSNAIKFTPTSGFVKISVNKEDSLIEMTVSDTGVGMNSKTLQSLFKIDKTVSARGTQGERGTGFGLLLCKEFVEKHSGTIFVESELGKGSNIKITLPVK